MPTELPIIDIVPLVPILLCNDILHLADKTPTSFPNSLARFLEPILCSTPKVRLDPAGGNELRRRSGNIVTGYNQLFRAVPAADHTVGCLDEGIG